MVNTMVVNCRQSDNTCELSDAVFSTEVRDAVVYQLINSLQSSQRYNIASAKSRADVKGHSAKPWRQKGSGRARHGSRKSPLWRGGGVTFASGTPNWKRKINRKTYRLGLRMILSQLAREQRLSVIEQVYDGEAKTQQLLSWKKDLDLSCSVLLVVKEVNENLRLAARNLHDFEACTRSEINPIRLLSYDHTLLTVDVVQQLNEELQ